MPSVLCGVLLLLIYFYVPMGLSAAVAGRVIQDVRYRSDHEETRVVIELDGMVPYETGRLSRPDRLYVDLPKTRLAPDWERQTVQVNDGRVQTIRIAQNQADQVRIVLDLQFFGDYRVFTLLRPFRIVIDLRGAPPVSKNGTIPPPPAQESPPKAHQPTIVIDPGHGGKDPGAIGPRRLKEKTVVLQVAKELRKILRKSLPRYRVILTRDRDVFVPLKRRAEIANTLQADLFISLHANSSRRRRVSGIETWYLSFAANKRAKRMAARENQMSETQLSDLEIILRDLHETDRINESATLAGATQTALVNYMGGRYRGITNRGLDGAPFVVLLHTAMPSILVELSFVSNPRDERRLRSRSYRQSLAHGIFRGVRQFLYTTGRAGAQNSR